MESTRSRKSDDVPFYGGGSIRSARGVQCTAGFAVRLPGEADPYMLTAGHCFTDGEVVLREAKNAEGNDVFYGSVSLTLPASFRS